MGVLLKKYRMQLMTTVRLQCKNKNEASQKQCTVSGVTAMQSQGWVHRWGSWWEPQIYWQSLHQGKMGWNQTLMCFCAPRMQLSPEMTRASVKLRVVLAIARWKCIFVLECSEVRVPFSTPNLLQLEFLVAIKAFLFLTREIREGLRMKGKSVFHKVDQKAHS